jgi:hypothetical protein
LEAELADFKDFLSILLSTDFNSPPFDEPHVLKMADGREYRIEPGEYLLAKRFGDIHIIDFENLQMYVFNKPLKYPPWILALCYLFDDDYFFHYPEVVSLMFVRLVLDAVQPNAEIRLDVCDILDSYHEEPEEQELLIRELHAELAHSLVEKVNLYNMVFRSLFQEEEAIRDRYIKSQCRELLRRCDEAGSAAAKGRALEELTDLLFTSNSAMELVDKRVSTGDEEIDLVIKNNIDRPFWNALSSALFFAECKNWTTKVGAREVRDFEMKLRNHGKLVTVGFLVSIGGFSKEAAQELKRSGRDNYHVVLLDRDDIQDFISSSVGFFPWLERRAARFY